MMLVVGASGTLGGRVARRLLRRGERVRATSRRPDETLEDLRAAGAEAVAADLRDLASLRRALDGVKRIVTCAHGLHPDRSNRLRAVEEGQRALIDAAREVGVEHFVYVSAMAAAPDAPDAFSREKYATERYLRDSRLSWTIVRSVAFAEFHAFELMGEPLRDGGTVWMLGPGTEPVGWVATDEVAGAVVAALTEPGWAGRLVGVEGPELLTRHEVLSILEDTLGREARVRHVPLFVLRWLRHVLRVLYPPASDLLAFALAEEDDPERFTTPPAHARRFTASVTLEELARRWADSQPGEPANEAIHADHQG